jgi:hypothetical protein
LLLLSFLLLFSIPFSASPIFASAFFASPKFAYPMFYSRLAHFGEVLKSFIRLGAILCSPCFHLILTTLLFNLMTLLKMAVVPRALFFIRYVFIQIWLFIA